MKTLLSGLVWGIILFLLVVAPRESAAGEPGRDKVRIGVSGKSIGFLDVWAAQEKGFYRKHGLQPEVIAIRPDLTIMALQTGQMDYTYVSGQVVRAILRGLPLKVVTTGLKSPFLTLVAKPVYKSPTDLKRKIIAVSSISGTDAVVTSYLLQRGGLDPRKDVVYMQMGGSETRYRSLLSGVIDATALSIPHSILAKRQGFSFMGSAGDVLTMQFTGIGTSIQKIQQDREQVRRMIRSQRDTMKWIKNQKVEVVRFIQEWLKVDEGIAEESYQVYVHVMNESAMVLPAAIKSVIQAEGTASGEALEHAFAKVADPTIAEEVLKEER
jgi:ABC-type nitrate/sulfonate/bicarbonate transport system substrate-binding protein